MNGLPYYKRYPRDFIEGTLGMSFEAKGAYAIVLDLIYMQGGSLPDDARYISGLLNVSVRKWKSLRSELVAGGKIQVSGEFLTNYRAVSELETLSKLQEKQSENASAPRKNKGLRKPRLSHTEPDTDTDILSNDNIPQTPTEKIAVDLYNEAASRLGLSSVQKLTKARKQKLLQRLNDCGGIDGWKQALTEIENSSFLTGDNQRGWKADFDFLIQEKSFTRLMEGAYGCSKTRQQSDMEFLANYASEDLQ